MSNGHDYTDPKIYGVVVAVFCPSTQRFLVLQECKDKPEIYKCTGMLAFPSETKEPYDKDVLATFRRAVIEEVGLTCIVDEDIFIREQPLEGLPHSVRIYGGWIIVEREFEPTNIDDDVLYVGWMTADEIRCEARVIERFRYETIPVLNLVVRGRGGTNA